MLPLWAYEVSVRYKGQGSLDQESTIEILRKGLGGVAGLHTESKEEYDSKTKEITKQKNLITKALQQASYSFQWAKKTVGVTNKTFGRTKHGKPTKPAASSPHIL